MKFQGPISASGDYPMTIPNLVNPLFTNQFALTTELPAKKQKRRLKVDGSKICFNLFHHGDEVDADQSTADWRLWRDPRNTFVPLIRFEVPLYFYFMLDQLFCCVHRSSLPVARSSYDPIVSN